jgi:hypothetical protein
VVQAFQPALQVRTPALLTRLEKMSAMRTGIEGVPEHENVQFLSSLLLGESRNGRYRRSSDTRNWNYRVSAGMFGTSCLRQQVVGQPQ